MRGDFTRDTFDPKKHFSRVLRQQGRVDLDADFNEQTAILLYQMRTLALDVFGVAAGPANALGFELIGKSMPSDERRAKIRSMEPDEDRCEALLDAIAEHNDIVIGTGRYYVHGVLTENHRPILYSEQLGYPFSHQTTLEELRKAQQPLLAYLDVWERHLTSIDDDSIREPALGGPDTSSRAQVVWQVKVLLPSDQTAEVFDCSATKSLPTLGTGKLRARVPPATAASDLCVIPPQTRYRGAENQLYRVEIHRAGSAGTAATGATFKWSRDNGSNVFELDSLSGSLAILRHLGRDRRSSLAPEDWVEIVDDNVVFGEVAGVLAKVERVDPDTLEVTLKLAEGAPRLPAYTASEAREKHAYLRRWDHVGDPNAGGAIAVTEQNTSQSGWLALEDGVEVAFDKGGKYLVGDYWLIPARTATGDVEWPVETGNGGEPLLDADGHTKSLSRPARGPRHHFAPLLLVRPGAQGQRSASDCRCAIAPLRCGYHYAYTGIAIGADNI